mgnify:FL=1
MLVHDHAVLQDPPLQCLSAHPTAAGKGFAGSQMAGALEDIQIGRAGSQMVVHIDADTLPSGTGDLKVVGIFIVLKATVFYTDQFLFHGWSRLLKQQGQRNAALRPDSHGTEDVKAVVLTLWSEIIISDRRIF